jgi:hypothetical protein
MILKGRMKDLKGIYLALKSAKYTILVRITVSMLACHSSGRWRPGFDSLTGSSFCFSGRFSDLGRCLGCS